MSINNLENLIIAKIIDRKKPLVIGVSGGPDSACLLDLCSNSKLKIIVCHINHNLRKESGDEEKFVKDLAFSYKYEFYCKSINLFSTSSPKNSAIEEKARKQRYEFLFTQAKQSNAQAVLTAHNADDQIETLLMHLLRGSGLRGLAGMKEVTLPNEWDQNIPLIRPLLFCFRKEIVSYCEMRNLKFVTDRSNFDKTFFRNRIRHELIPILESYNNNFKKLTLQTITQLSEENDYLAQRTREILKRLAYKLENKMITIDHHKFNLLNQSDKRRVVMFCIEKMDPKGKNNNFTAVERAIESCKESVSGFRIDLVNSIVLKVEDSKIVFFLRQHERTVNSYPQLRDEEIILDPEKELYLNENYKIFYNIVQNQPGTDFYYHAENEVFIAAESIQSPLFFRKREEGDKFSPLGEPNKHVKISDLMINMKIPNIARQNYPILCDQRGVIWVPFLRMADRVKVVESTKLILHIDIKNVL